MGYKERQQIKKLSRELKRRNTNRQITSAGNTFLATILIGGLVTLVTIMIVLAVWMF